MHKCVVSGKTIPTERVEALKMLGIPEDQWTCVEYSQVKHKQGIYLGEAGTSELLMVNKLFDDSVRSVFNSNKRYLPEESDAEDEESDNVDTHVYSSKEMNYYMQADESEDPSEDVEIIKKRDV